MSADNDKHFFVNPFPVVMVALLAAGVFVGAHELQSGRPADPERAKFVPTTDQDVEARLWQDPLAAVEAAAEARAVRPGLPPAATNDVGARPYGPGRLQKRISEKMRKGERITVLAVTAFGGSYTQAAENRRRLRFAVISALGFQQYQPERPDALGYVLFDLAFPAVPRDTNFLMLNVRSSGDNSKTNNYVQVIHAAYEWFKRPSSQKSNLYDSNQQKFDNVLLIWLNEDLISKSPQDYFNKIFNELHCLDNLCHDDDLITFKLIGPNDSDTFSQLIIDRTTTQERKDDRRALFDVFSPSATMSADDLQKVGGLAQPISPSALADLAIVRTTDTDDHLARALLGELRLRGVTTRCEDGVILVREADTKYSASLSAHLKREFCPAMADSNKGIREFTYLRGIDGALPSLDKKIEKQESSDSRRDENDKSKNIRAQLDNVRPEFAEGRNQSDYLRRLADQIAQLDNDANFAKNGVKAIGIIGNDVYDKLLILRALRDQLPDKIFFTTDLDARYLHADQKEAARNLVIASNFDFMLHPKLQGSTLPFRDTYQTAAYLATLMALETHCPRCWSDKVGQWVRPQIFEIGRTQAVSLNYLNNDSDCRMDRFPGEGAAISNWTECQRIEPIRPLSLPAFTAKTCLLVVMTVVGSILLISVTTYSLKYWLNNLIDKRTVIRIGIILFMTLSIIGIIYYEIGLSLEEGTGEPFFWLEGVSVWPSIILRFLGITATVLLALFIKTRNDIQAEETSTCFGLGIPTRWNTGESIWKALCRGPYMDVISFHSYTNKKKLNSESISTLWKYYISFTGWRSALPWVGTSVLLMSLIGVAIVATLGPPSFPGRGSLVRWLNIISILLSTLTVWFTVFWVIYETRACAGFINILSDMEEVQTGWANTCREIDPTVPDSTYRNAYLAFRLIVRTTQRIQRLIYLPFVSILFVVAARSNLFDALNFPISLIVLNVVAAAYALSSAIRLRSGAKAAKENIIDQIENLRSSPVGSSQPTHEQIDLGLRRIRETREGAFAPLGEQPLLQAFLLPFGGYGGLQLIESLFSV